MLLAVGGLVGLVAGLFTGGNLRNLLERRLRWPLVVIAALVTRELEIRTPLGGAAWGPAIFALSLAVLMVWAAWHHDRLPGIWLVVVGIGMNLAVVLFNGGRMPVAVAAAHLGPAQLREQGTFAQYTLAGPDTRLGWLCDWIVLPPPVGRLFPQAYSPGDLVSVAGFAVVLFLATRPDPRSTSRRVITTR
ncbi:MAG TPA: DUF5317 domain-containing protein [Candidatus Dormibacteraeota bacterium]|nr:DUF5317 domain-containing protein [Candidatus Dormibacteraeota bacterium]